IIYFSLAKTKYNILVVTLSYVFLFLGLVATGSRGGTVILIFCTLPFLIYMRTTGLFKYIMAVSIMFILSLAWVYWEFVSNFMGRLLFFDLNNSSEATRISMYENLFYFLKFENSLNLLLGLGNLNYLYPEKGFYPHNLIIELVVYHGLIYFFIVVFFSIYALYSFISKPLMFKVLSVFIPIAIGTMLSGDLTDNYIVFLFIPVLFFYSNKDELFND
ncbi:O-antigen ligase, partial [Shewanella sp. SR43-8]|uniref:O-antigen ligase family protein n=1 Tax=Shewanella sp. SR43-8 TaxID=2760938 RepID=UPI00160427B7